MIAQTVPELTNYEYNELYYNSAGTLITGSYVYQVCDLLNKCGVDTTLMYITTQWRQVYHASRYGRHLPRVFLLPQHYKR